MTNLAEFLNVDESWLALGVTAAVTKPQRETMKSLAKGAVHMIAGMAHFAGGHSAFPAEDDPMAKLVDVYVILNGKHVAMHVAVSTEQDDGSLAFIIPREYDRVHVVGATARPHEPVTFLDFPTTLIDNNKEAFAGGYKLTVNRFTNKLVVPKGKLNTFQSLGEIL